MLGRKGTETSKIAPVGGIGAKARFSGAALPLRCSDGRLRKLRQRDAADSNIDRKRQNFRLKSGQPCTQRCAPAIQSTRSTIGAADFAEAFYTKFFSEF